MLSMLQRALMASAGSVRGVEWIGAATSQSSGFHQWSFDDGDISGVLPGDLLILQVFGRETIFTSPVQQSGWTTAFSDVGFDSGFGEARLYYRTVGGDSSIAVNGTNANGSAGAALMCFRNAQFVSHSNSAADTVVTPNITMDRGDMSLALYFAQSTGAWENLSSPIPGYTDWAQYASNYGNPAFTGKGAACYREITSNGATTGGSWGGTIPAANFMRCTNVRLSPL